MKQILQILGMIMMILMSFLPASSYDFEVDNKYYNVISLDDMTCELTCMKEENYESNVYKGDIVVPSEVSYNGKTFSVIRIGSYAFRNSSEALTITLPNSINTIGYSAFKDCTKLKNINLPDGITDIGSSAFDSCEALESISIPKGLKEIPGDMLYRCASLREIIIPSNITRIGAEAFNRSGIERVIIEDSESAIELKGSFIQSFENNECFYHSGSFFGMPLKILYLGRNFFISEENNYNYSPFLGLDTLEEIKIGGFVTELPANTFVKVTGFIEGNLSAGKLPVIYYIGPDNFKKITILEGKDDLVFVNGIWGDRYRKYYDSLILDYYNVKEAVFERNVYSSSKIEYPHFLKNVEKVYLINKFSNIGKQFFKGSKLKYLKLGPNIETIGQDAFSGADDLLQICLQSINPPTFDGDPLFGNKQYMNAELFVPDSSIDIYKQSDYWKKFWNIKPISEYSAISEIMHDADASLNIVNRYDLNGRVVSDNYKGIVIVLFSDGTTKKIIQN